MAGGFASVGDGIGQIAVLGTVNSGGPPQTSAGAANTKGAWAQFIASTPIDATAIMIQLSDNGTINTEYSVDIGIGPSGSEIVLIPDLRGSDAASRYPNDGNYMFPVNIPAGTRISTRGQNILGAAGGPQLQIHVLQGDFGNEGGSGVDTYGFQSATTLGVAVDPGATINTKGAWTEITPGLTNDIIGWSAFIDNQTQTGTSRTLYKYAVDFAVGPSGSELIILPNYFVTKMLGIAATGAGGYITAPLTPYIPMRIPAGTRVSARCQCIRASNPADLLGVTFYGVRT